MNNESKVTKRHKIYLFIVSLLAVLIAMFSCSGCSSTPFAWESKVYDIQTNITPVVIYQTNTVTRTNVIESVVTTTNVVASSGAIQITMTPTKEYTVVSEPVVTIKTNYQVDYTYTTSTNTQSSLETASGIASLFNPAAGGLVSLLGGGLLGLWAKLRSTKKIAVGLAQGIEVGRELMLKLPKGELYDAKYTEWLHEHQRELNVVKAVGAILETSVNTPAAQKVAEGIKVVLDKATEGKPHT